MKREKGAADGQTNVETGLHPRKEHKRRGISGSTIKLIAVITMLIDHIGAVVLQRMMTAEGYMTVMDSQNMTLMTGWAGEHPLLFWSYTVMRLIGRISFPLFCFLLVEGFQKTKDVRKYMLRLAAFALISEIPFDLAVSGKVLEFGSQNVFFTLLLGMFFLYAGSRLMQTKTPGIRMVAVMLGTMLLAELLQTDYGAVGILVIVFLYLFRFERIKAGGFACALLGMVSLDGIASFVALIPLALYNGERGLKLKYFFYVFYPVHLLLLYLAAGAMGLGNVAVM